MVLDKPCDAVVWTAPFFISGESDDEVAVGHETLFPELDEIGEPDGGLRFVVTRTAAVEVAVALVELEGIDAPVLALGFDDINVSE